MSNFLNTTITGTLTNNGPVNITGRTTIDDSLESKGEIYVNNWFRVKGNNRGIYWEDGGGGWFMNDATWVRAYNGKGVAAKMYWMDVLGAGYATCSPVGGDGIIVSRFRWVSSDYVEITLYNGSDFSYAAVIGFRFFWSDRRLKSNIEPTLIHDACNDIKQMRFVRFKWPETGLINKGKVCELGLIAQELEEINPSFIYTASDTDKYGDGKGTYNMDTNVLLTYNLKATQELITRVETLEEENKKLKNEIEEIKKMLAKNNIH